MITQEKVKELFFYDSASGNLISKKSGKIVGSFTDKGYLVTRAGKKVHRIHRLVFLYHHGYVPEQIDHINGIRHDNRIENLREATAKQNSYNRKALSKTGVKGVYWNKKSKKWIAGICIDRKSIHLGSFDDIESAIVAATDARKNIHKEFFKEVDND